MKKTVTVALVRKFMDALFIVVVVLVVFVAPAMISVVVVVRVVIVLNTAAITFSVACIVFLAIVV